MTDDPTLTSNFAVGLIVPIPTFPSESMRSLSKLFVLSLKLLAPLVVRRASPLEFRSSTSVASPVSVNLIRQSELSM